METRIAVASEQACQHRWLLGQPEGGRIQARCRKCGAHRFYPAVLDDLDPGIGLPERYPAGVATAAGGARPSSVAVLSAELEA
jgi:hypothetical protein